MFCEKGAALVASFCYATLKTPIVFHVAIGDKD